MFFSNKYISKKTKKYKFHSKKREPKFFPKEKKNEITTDQDFKTICLFYIAL